MRCDGWEQLLVMGWRWALAEHMAKPAHRRAQKVQTRLTGADKFFLGISSVMAQNPTKFDIYWPNFLQILSLLSDNAQGALVSVLPQVDSAWGSCGSTSPGRGCHGSSCFQQRSKISAFL